METLQEFKCPCCGGAISFDSNIQKMKCPYCDTEFDIETIKSYNEDVKNDDKDNMDWKTDDSKEWEDAEGDGIRSYVCKSCGGEIVADENTAATSCPYCGNPVVMNEKLSGMLKPDLVIPFKLDKAAAKDALAKYLKGKRLMPKIFKDENHIDEIKGVYVPFWLFDANADARMRYRATKVRHWSDSSYMYTETRHYSVVREGDLGFAHVPVDGSSKMADELMESIEPFDYLGTVDFKTAYLAGYLADKYDVSAEDCIGNANARVKNSTEAMFRDTVHGYSTVRCEGSSVKLSGGKAQYVLYPVWILNTTWKGKKYQFAMNGQTGKLVGNLPTDKGAYCRWLFGIAGAVSALVFGISSLLWFI